MQPSSDLPRISWPMALIRPIGTVPVRHGRELNRNETPRTGGHRAGAQTETNTQGCCRACRPQLLGPKGSNLSIRTSYEEQHSAAAAEGRDSVAGRTASGHRIPLRIDGQGHCACLVCVCVAGRGRQGSRRPASRNQAARARGSGFPGRDRQPARLALGSVAPAALAPCTLPRPQSRRWRPRR